MKKFLTYIRSHAVISGGIAIVAVITMIIAGRVASRGAAVDTNQSNIKKVSLVDVSTFTGNNSKIAADGIVESVSQADLKSQISAPLATVNVAIGDTVSKGQTIATLQNADIRAQLDQARAGLQISSNGGSVSLESAQKSAIDTLRSGYITADEIINIKLAQILYKGSASGVSLASFAVDSKLSNSIRDYYLSGLNSFGQWQTAIDKAAASSDNTDIEAAISLSQKNLTTISRLLDSVSEAINQSIRDVSGTTFTTLSGWQDTVTVARNSTNTSLKNVTSAEASLSNTEAQTSSTAASVRNLEAQYAKTIITSPISGKIAALPLRTGELAQPGQLLATVVGGGGLQIKAYASGEDLSQLKVSSNALIQGKIPGKVVSVAPSVNQVNKKIEIKVAVADEASSDLVIGQNVSISIEAFKDILASSTDTKYLLPIQNIKIIPGAAYVFTIDENSKIVKNSITIGKIEGDFIEVVDGIRPDMKIVSPVYELEEGEKVIVQ